MKIRKKDGTNERYLILKENDMITILADKEMKSSISIMCKNKKLFLNFIENERLSHHKKKSDDSLKITEKKK